MSECRLISEYSCTNAREGDIFNARGQRMVPSGQFRGRRHISGGRAQVRSILLHGCARRFTP